VPAQLWALCGVAATLWFVMFSPWTKDLFNFWAAMALSAGVLSVSGLIAGRGHLREIYRFKPVYILIGVISAAVLYGIFFAGNYIVREILDFAPRQIAGIYATREQGSALTVGLLLLLWVGPAEEIFWRGYVQDRLSRRFSPLWGYLLATAVYTFVHIWSGNFMLLAASAVCGLFWGLIYLRFRSVWPGLISHALWDAAIFVVWPIGMHLQ